jgi:hypothetical protein
MPLWRGWWSRKQEAGRERMGWRSCWDIFLVVFKVVLVKI